MKHIVMSIISFLYLFISCSNEELQETGNKLKLVPITVLLPGGEITTKADEGIVGKPSIPGDAVEADHVQVLVYRNKQKRGSAGYNATDAAQYRYDATNGRSPVGCKVSGNDKIAQDVFSVDPEYDYWVLAYAYKEIDKSSFAFTYGGESLLSDKVSILPTIVNKEYHAPEFYYGLLHTVDDADDHIIVGNKVAEAVTDIGLTGTIYRSVGRITLTLTDVPAEISRLNLIVEKYPESCPLYAVVNGYAPYHPIGYPLADDLITTGVTIKTVDKNEITNSAAVFTANTLRIDESYVYVEAIKGEGTSATSMKYLVKCPDYEIYTVVTAIKEYIVESYKITIPINFHVKIKGSYNDLTKGNLSIDGGSMDERFEGFLE